MPERQRELHVDRLPRAAWAEGGLGRLNVGTRQFSNFVRSLHDSNESVTESTWTCLTRQAVISALSVNDDEVWFVTSRRGINRLRRYNDKSHIWYGEAGDCTSLAIDQKRIVSSLV